MAKRHYDDHEEHEGGHDEPWLVSYADMMTLLFGFFVLMYSFASKDKSEEWEKVQRDLAKYFGSEYITPSDELSKDIKKAIDQTPLARDVDQQITNEGLEITFRSTILFESGKEKILPGAVAPMRSLAEVVIAKKDSYLMVVEGHTDDSPIATERFPSNWELSAGRATTVLRLFEELGYPRDRMRAVALADVKPLLPNRGAGGEILPDNQARNRRVVIKLIATMKRPPPAAPGSASPGVAAAPAAAPNPSAPE